MSFPSCILASALTLFVLAPFAAAQDAPTLSDSVSVPAVRLDVKHLSIDSVAVEAAHVEAHLRIDASVAPLLRIEAGVSLRIDSAHVVVSELDAAADLRVHLDVVARVLLEALGVVDRHPEVVTTSDPAEGAVGATPPRNAPRERDDDEGLR